MSAILHIVEISEDLVLGSIGFIILLMSGAVGAFTSAKREILMTLFSVLSGLDLGAGLLSALPVAIILYTIIVVFFAIPGTVGLFRMMTNQ